MKTVKLLDCTLRDGGYINDWNFGNDKLISIYERLVSANIDIIELGFIDDRRIYDFNRSIVPDTHCFEGIYGKVDKKNCMIVGMIDYGTCKIENIQPCDDSYLDGIRVIFKKEIMYDALEYCKKIKNLGYKVFVNCVSITSYSESELTELITNINKVLPHAVSIVDTYGLLHQEGLMKIFHSMDALLDESIELAYHPHNNFQLGYANSMEFFSQNTERTLIVDGTLFGMGKSAGNAPLELLAMHMNEKYSSNYDMSQILDAIENEIMELYSKYLWGYKPFFFISASKKVHPNYVSFLINKGTLSIKSINHLLEKLSGDKKLLYDQKLIEELYLEYQKNECDDTANREMLKGKLSGKEILIIGPGVSVQQYSNEIEEYINEFNPEVIAINAIPNSVVPDYVFASNNKRYTKLIAKLTNPSYSKVKVIATSNLVPVDREFTYELNYNSLIDADTDIPDNSLIMLMRLLTEVSPKKIALAGFDGYSRSESNYLVAEMEYSFVKEKAEYLNRYNSTMLSILAKEIEIEFITPSKYSIHGGM